MVHVCLDCINHFGMCTCLPAFAVGIGLSGVCLSHVLIVMCDVRSCFELRSALSQSSWIRRYIRIMYCYY